MASIGLFNCQACNIHLCQHFFGIGNAVVAKIGTAGKYYNFIVEQFNKGVDVMLGTKAFFNGFFDDDRHCIYS